MTDVAPLPDRLPLGYRFTSPFLGDCEITGYVEQTAEQFMRDEPPLPFDYIVRCGPDRAKKPGLDLCFVEPGEALRPSTTMFDHLVYERPAAVSDHDHVWRYTYAGG